MFSARLSNISSPWANFPQRIHSKLELLFRPERVRRRKHLLLITKTNYGERSCVYVGPNVKCASFLVLPKFNKIWIYRHLLVKTPNMKLKNKNIPDGSRTDTGTKTRGGQTWRNQESLFESVLWKCLIMIELTIARKFYQKTKNP